MKRLSGFAWLGLSLVALATGAEPEFTHNDYADPANWLCQPGRADDCAADMRSTEVRANGSLEVENWKPNPNAKIDCFYVYPTVSLDPSPVSDMLPGPEEHRTTQSQFTRFASQCRPYAPMYRQGTLTQLRANAAKGALGPPPATGRVSQGYVDVVDAWNYYLAHENKGRGVVLVGHSQGASVLGNLLKNEIDGKPAQKQLISAILMGATLMVPPGKDVGGSLQHIPLCRSISQVGCVIAYASYRATVPPPANSLFARPREPGLVPVCVNPAELDSSIATGKSDGKLKAYLSSGGAGNGSAGETPPWTKPAKAIGTPFVSVPGLLTAACVERDNAHYLAITVHGDPQDARTDDISGDVLAGGQVNPVWGLHLIDANLAMGNLVEVIRQQGKAFVKAHR